MLKISTAFKKAFLLQSSRCGCRAQPRARRNSGRASSPVSITRECRQIGNVPFLQLQEETVEATMVSPPVCWSEHTFEESVELWLTPREHMQQRNEQMSFVPVAQIIPQERFSDKILIRRARRVLKLSGRCPCSGCVLLLRHILCDVLRLRVFEMNGRDKGAPLRACPSQRPHSFWQWTAFRTNDCIHNTQKESCKKHLRHPVGGHTKRC